MTDQTDTTPSADQSPIERARAIVEAMGPTPWRVEAYGDGDSLVIHDARAEWRICFMATPGDSPGAMDKIKANAAGIVFSASLARVLVAEETVPDLADAAFAELRTLLPRGRAEKQYEEAVTRAIINRLAALALGASHAER